MTSENSLLTAFIDLVERGCQTEAGELWFDAFQARARLLDSLASDDIETTELARFIVAAIAWLKEAAKSDARNYSPTLDQLFRRAARWIVFPRRGLSASSVADLERVISKDWQELLALLPVDDAERLAQAIKEEQESHSQRTAREEQGGG